MSSIVIPRRDRREATRESGFRLLMYLAVGIAVVALGALLYDVINKGAGSLSTDFLTEFPSQVRPESAGIESAIVGTLWLMVITAVIVVPLGVMTAIYLEEYAQKYMTVFGRQVNVGWLNRLIEVNIQNLASVPSVVYGLLGLAFIVRGPLELGRVVLAGGITLALLVLPVVIIVSREAIRAVPPSIRDGALALGATKWQTIWKQVLPGSIAGIATGIILALSRAIGETAPLLVIGAAVNPRFNPELSLDGLDSEFTALPIQIFSFSTADLEVFKIDYAAATILVLLAILLLMNSVAIYLRNRFEQKW